MDATKVQLGTCEVFLNGTSQGHTIGGVEVTYSPEYHETSVDQYGSTKVEKFLVGEKLTAKVPLAEYTLNNIKVAIPFGTQNAENVTVGSIAGKRATDHVAVLRLHPIVNASTNRNDDINMFKAFQTGEIVIGLKNDGEKVFECMFEALVDEGRSDGSLLAIFGDSI